MSDETQATIQRFHDALNSHDIDALAPLVHDECVFETTAPPDGTRHEGRAAVLDACREFFEQSPDARFEMEEVVTGRRPGVRPVALRLGRRARARRRRDARSGRSGHRDVRVREGLGSTALIRRCARSAQPPNPNSEGRPTTSATTAQQQALTGSRPRRPGTPPQPEAHDDHTPRCSGRQSSPRPLSANGLWSRLSARFARCSTTLGAALAPQPPRSVTMKPAPHQLPPPQLGNRHSPGADRGGRERRRNQKPATTTHPDSSGQQSSRGHFGERVVSTIRSLRSLLDHLEDGCARCLYSGTMEGTRRS